MNKNVIPDNGKDSELEHIVRSLVLKYGKVVDVKKVGDSITVTFSSRRAAEELYEMRTLSYSDKEKIIFNIERVSSGIMVRNWKPTDSQIIEGNHSDYPQTDPNYPKSGRGNESKYNNFQSNNSSGRYMPWSNYRGSRPPRFPRPNNSRYSPDRTEYHGRPMTRPRMEFRPSGHRYPKYYG